MFLGGLSIGVVFGERNIVCCCCIYLCMCCMLVMLVKFVVVYLKCSRLEWLSSLNFDCISFGRLCWFSVLLLQISLCMMCCVFGVDSFIRLCMMVCVVLLFIFIWWFCLCCQVIVLLCMMLVSFLMLGSVSGMCRVSVLSFFGSFIFVFINIIVCGVECWCCMILCSMCRFIVQCMKGWKLNRMKMLVFVVLWIIFSVVVVLGVIGLLCCVKLSWFRLLVSVQCYSGCSDCVMMW